LKSSRGSVALCGPTWVGRTHAGVRCGISATRNSFEITGATKIEIPCGNIHAITECPHPGDPMPAFLSGPGPRPTPTPAC
jgi:hypothetical protein